jgi:hypothetical protein
MTSSQPFVERELVLVPHANKNRPAIVLRVEAERVVVLVWGTGTPRDLPRVEVRPETRDGKALGFYKPTYFYPNNRLAVLPSLLIATGKRCPPELFLKLRQLVERGLR